MKEKLKIILERARDSVDPLEELEQDLLNLLSVHEKEIWKAADDQFPEWIEDGMGGIAGKDNDYEEKQQAFVWGSEWVLKHIWNK